MEIEDEGIVEGMEIEDAGMGPRNVLLYQLFACDLHSDLGEIEVPLGDRWSLRVLYSEAWLDSQG